VTFTFFKLRRIELGLLLWYYPLPTVTLSTAYCDAIHCLLWHYPLPTVTLSTAYCEAIHCLLWHYPLPTVTLSTAYCDAIHCLPWRYPLPTVTLSTAYDLHFKNLKAKGNVYKTESTSMFRKKKDLGKKKSSLHSQVDETIQYKRISTTYSSPLYLFLNRLIHYLS
jgi:hypothetical protein